MHCSTAGHLMHDYDSRANTMLVLITAPPNPGSPSCPATTMKAHSGQHAGKADDNTAWSILPAELWLDILCLCAPKPHLPATSRSTSSMSQPGSPAQRIWAYHVIFLNPEYDPEVVNAADLVRINSWYPSISQCESHFAYYLKAHVPATDNMCYECASGLAPEPGQHVPATVFSVAMVEWLFDAAGPFGRQSRQTADKELDVFEALAQVWPALDSHTDSDSEPDNDDHDEEEADEVALVAADTSATLSLATTAPAEQPLLPTWRLIPDPFLLATFLIRTSQLDLLELTLTRMRTLFPALLASTAPFSLWSHLMSDYRPELLSILNQLVDSGDEDPNDDPHMSYSTFLCFLALIDWSKPALDVIARVLADSFDASVAASLVTSNRRMMESILSTLHQLTSPPSDSSRVLSLLNWFQANSAHSNLDDFPYLSHHITGSYPIFADVFLLHDLANLPLLVDNPERHALGSAVAQWVIHGHPDLLPVALENDLLDDEAKGTVMRYAAKKGDEDGLLATVAVHCAGDVDTLTNVVLHALNISRYSDPDPPNMYSMLLNALVKFSPMPIDPTAILVQHSETWSPWALSIMLTDQPTVDALLFFWDYARYLEQYLTWVVSDWSEQPDNVEFEGNFVDKCIEEPGVRWDELSAEKAATACAVRLVAALRKYEFFTGLDRMDVVMIVNDKDMSVIEFISSLAAAKIADANSSAESDDDESKKPFSRLIPPRAYDVLCEAIRSASIFSPKTVLTCCNPLTAHSTDCPVSNPRAIHNVILDTFFKLDHAFFVAHVAWRHPGCARVCGRFKPATAASRVSVHRAVGFLRVALYQAPAHDVAGQVMGLVNELPQVVLESKVFVRGLRGLMRMRGMSERTGGRKRVAMMSGLDASRLGGEWRERIASVTLLPEDDDSEAEEEEEPEFSLFD